MRRTLLATTAVASMLAFGAVAQQAADPADAPAAATPAEPAAPATPEADAMEPAADTAEEVVPDATPDTETAQPAPGAAPMDTGAADVVLTPVAPDEISADTLIGAPIQTMNGENIAEIEDVLVSAEGAVENVVAQFGGFLGFGSNKVLLTMDEIEVMQDEAGGIVVQTALTPESLEGRPEYQEEN
jgi:hypothetical protein